MNSDSLEEKAIQLEQILPRIIIDLFVPRESDPLQYLPVAQLKTVRVLFEGGPKSHSAVSDELGISVSAVTQVANRLEALGYVERVESARDRRVKLLKLTSHGVRLMAARRDYRVEQALRALSALDTKTQDQLLSVLKEFDLSVTAHRGDKKGLLSTSKSVGAEEEIA